MAENKKNKTQVKLKVTKGKALVVQEDSEADVEGSPTRERGGYLNQSVSSVAGSVPDHQC